MFESLEKNSTIDVGNNLTYQDDSKLFKNILKIIFYVEIKNMNIMQ